MPWNVTMQKFIATAILFGKLQDLNLCMDESDILDNMSLTLVTGINMPSWIVSKGEIDRHEKYFCWFISNNPNGM